MTMTFQIYRVLKNPWVFDVCATGRFFGLLIEDVSCFNLSSTGMHIVFSIYLTNIFAIRNKYIASKLVQMYLVIFISGPVACLLINGRLFCSYPLVLRNNDFATIILPLNSTECMSHHLRYWWSNMT